MAEIIKQSDEKAMSLPLHVGIIMDGNGRWATKRSLPRKAGHREGAKAFEKIVEHAAKRGVKHLTVYAFSTENFSRPPDEVEAVMDLMRSYLNDRRKSRNKDVRTIFIGSREGLAPDIVESIRLLEEDSRAKTGMIINVAFNYGGKQEVLRAAKELARRHAQGALELEAFGEDDFDELLYTAGQPPVDLLIRTSGEERLSNFLIWQSAYSEFVFTPVLWPDFTPAEFDKALEEYAGRHRRIGGL
ncbi:MAG: polyprenyl diphosphate synthase [Oscillospiraceae bacterium]